jgi:hypothetical protein
VTRTAVVTPVVTATAVATPPVSPTTSAVTTGEVVSSSSGALTLTAG